MNKKFSTKRALVASVLMLALCFSMLVGTTFAWFTDSVTSSGNVIQTGKLDVAMYWAEGDEDPNAVTAWTDASKGAIFKNEKWEPGYAEAKHIKIANEGTLALSYQMRVIATGVVSELANVIDVYYFADAKQLTRGDFTAANKLGTLAQFLMLADDKGAAKTITGSLEEGTSKTVTLAFKMQESAGNEYQEMSIGSEFAIQLLATQYTSESDSFDNMYDDEATFGPQEIPKANVFQLPANKLSNITIAGMNGATVDTGYSFQPTETFDQVTGTEFEWAHADFFVYADAAVPANSMALAGYYQAFDGFNWEGEKCTANTWIGLTADTDIAAGQANGIRLLGDGMGLPGVSYSEICQYGNDGIGFLCGATDLTGANEGTTLYVELRVYKIDCKGTCGGHHNSFDCESGEYEVIGKFEYTFDNANMDRLADGSVVEYADNGEVILADVNAVTTDEYYVPDGITAINGSIFSQNADIKTVVIPETVTDFGATGVSATNASNGAFKGSAVETVVLPEGMTEIPAAAFNGAKNLKTVNIPASVETIGVNAFRQTALTTLVIPATVKTVEYGAFRDMSVLETVIAEGDIHIPDYAFRGCPALRNVYLNGANTTVGSNMAFANASSNNPGTNNIKFYVKSALTAAQVKACMGVGTDFWIYVDGEEATIVNNDAQLKTAIQNATGETATIVLGEGTYSQNIDLTVAALGEAQVKNLIFKAASKNAVIAGTVTLGYRNQGVGAAMWNADVTFDGVTFQPATADTHSINVQDVKSLNLINCAFINNGEYGIESARGNATGTSKIVGCTFENAGMQLLGNFATGLVIDDCEFNNSKVNVQAGNGVTVQNCKFNSTLTAANIDDSFYLIRSNSTPITVKNCEIKIDSALTEVVTTAQAKWYLLANRGTTNWTVENVAVTMTDAAVAQTQIKVTACTSTGVINATNLTVNGVQQ